MTISETKDTARKTLSGKLGNAYIITSLYTLITFSLKYISKLLSFKNTTFSSLLIIVFGLIQLFFGYGLISNLIKISKQQEPVPYTGFITDAILNITKVFKLIIGIFFRLLLPLLGLSIILYIESYLSNMAIDNNNYKLASILMLIVFILAFIGIIIYVLNFAFAIFCLIDENDKSTTELLKKSKNLIKGNKLNYIKLVLSFIFYYILIFLVGLLLSRFLDTFAISIILTILSMLLTPYITISQYIFYEELQPIEKE